MRPAPTKASETRRTAATRATSLAAATAGVLLCATLVGIAGLAVGELVPDRLVATHLSEARAEGSLTDTSQEPSRLGGISDHFTECITISVGLGEAPDAGFLETLAEGTHLGPCDRLVPALDTFDGGGGLPPGRAYLRYWHGTSGLFRPLIALLGLSELRLLAFGALVVSAISLARAVRRVAGAVAAVALLAPLVVTTDFVELTDVAHHAVAVAVALAAAHLVLVACGKHPGLAPAWFASVLGGAMFVYVDLLTIAPGAWLLAPAMAMLAARRLGAPTVGVFAIGWTAGLGWLVGYAGMWFGKWLFAAAVLGRRRVHDDVRATIEQRIGGDSPWSEDRFGAAIGDNVAFWLARPFAWVVLGTTVVVVGLTVARRLRAGDRAELGVSATAAIPALVPFVWFELASNHSQIHHWFTYRSLPIAVGVVLLAALTPKRHPAATGRPVA